MDKLKFGCISLLLITVIIGFFGVGAFKVYYPIRLYYSGVEKAGIVDSTFDTYTKDASLLYLKDDSIEFDYHREFLYAEKGDRIRAIESKYLRKGVILSVKRKDSIIYHIEPRLFDVMENYDASEKRSDIYIYLIVSLVPFILALLFALNKMVKSIRLEIAYFKEKKKDTGDPEVLKTVGAYIPPLTYLAYAYGLFFLLFKGIFSVERNNEMLVGIMFYFGIIFVFFMPTIFFRIKKFFRETKHNWIKYGLQVGGMIFSIYGLIGLICFFSKYDLSSFKDLSELFKKLVSEIIKI